MKYYVIYTHKEVLCICIYVYIYIWIHKHTRKYYSDTKKSKLSPFVKIWVDSEGIMLSE